MKSVKEIKLSLHTARVISKLNETFSERQIKKGFKQPRPFSFKISKGK